MYTGRTGVSNHAHQGGAANYLCMPNDPEYSLSYAPGVRGKSYVYGTEYMKIHLFLDDLNIMLHVLFVMYLLIL